MTDNRERAIAEVAEEIGWTTEQVSYCTYSVMRIAVNQCEQKLDLLDALELLYGKYESGPTCTEDGEPDGGYMGNAVELSSEEENQILSALEAAGKPTALRSKRAAIAKAERKG